MAKPHHLLHTHLPSWPITQTLSLTPTLTHSLIPTHTQIHSIRPPPFTDLHLHSLIYLHLTYSYTTLSLTYHSPTVTLTHTFKPPITLQGRAFHPPYICTYIYTHTHSINIHTDLHLQSHTHNYTYFFTHHTTTHSTHSPHKITSTHHYTLKVEPNYPQHITTPSWLSHITSPDHLYFMDTAYSPYLTYTLTLKLLPRCLTCFQGFR